MSRKSQFFVHKSIEEGLEIDVEIIMDSHRGLIDSDLPSQIRWCRNGHRITNAAPDGVFKIFDLLL